MWKAQAIQGRAPHTKLEKALPEQQWDFEEYLEADDTWIDGRWIGDALLKTLKKSRQH
jgi:hypothetical protein